MNNIHIIIADYIGNPNMHHYLKYVNVSINDYSIEGSNMVSHYEFNDTINQDIGELYWHYCVHENKNINLKKLIERDCVNIIRTLLENNALSPDEYVSACCIDPITHSYFCEMNIISDQLHRLNGIELAIVYGRTDIVELFEMHNMDCNSILWDYHNTHSNHSLVQAWNKHRFYIRYARFGNCMCYGMFLFVFLSSFVVFSLLEYLLIFTNKSGKIGASLALISGFNLIASVSYAFLILIRETKLRARFICLGMCFNTFAHLYFLVTYQYVYLKWICLVFYPINIMIGHAIMFIYCKPIIDLKIMQY